MTESDVLVVGGGVAGLACASTLLDRGVDVRLVETRDTPGGNVRTDEVQGFRLERGPHSFMASADPVFALVDALHMTHRVTSTRPESADRFVVRDGRLHPIPTGPWSFLTTGLLSWEARFTLLTEPLRVERGTSDDTAEDFFIRRFGPEAARVLPGAFVSGVYAGDPAILSAEAAFPLFWGFEQETGSMIRGAYKHMRRRKAERKAKGTPARSGLYSFQGGLGALTRRAAEHLGDRYVGACPATSVVRGPGGYRVTAGGISYETRSLVLATPPGAAATLASDLDPDLSRDLSGIPMAPVAVVQLGFKKRLAAIPEGFGFLVPRGEGIRTLGVLFPSRLFTDRTPEGGDLLAGFLGGMRDGAALDLDDDALVSLLLGELKTLTGLDATPDLVDITRHRAAIPQFVMGHPERMDRIRARLRQIPGLFLAGNYLSGVGIKDAARSILAAADACTSWLGGGA